MGILTREALLGASDLRTEEVDLPSIGGSVKVRSLPAAYSNHAMSEALEVVTARTGEQTARVNTAKLEELQVLHGLVEPHLETLEEVRLFAQQTGEAWRLIVNRIDAISGISKADMDRANTTFRTGGPPEAGTPEVNGAGSGADRPDIPARTGA